MSRDNVREIKLIKLSKIIMSYFSIKKRQFANAYFSQLILQIIELR